MTATILLFLEPNVVLAVNGVPRLSTIPARLVPENPLTKYQFGEQRLSWVLPKKQTKEAFLSIPWLLLMHGLSILSN
jgi:hypothetical protein